MDPIGFNTQRGVPVFRQTASGAPASGELQPPAEQRESFASLGSLAGKTVLSSGAEAAALRAEVLKSIVTDAWETPLPGKLFKLAGQGDGVQILSLGESGEGTLYALDRENGGISSAASLGAVGEPGFLKIEKDRLTMQAGSELRVVDLKTGRDMLREPLDLDGNVKSNITIAPDGKVYSVDRQGAFKVSDPATGKSRHIKKLSFQCDESCTEERKHGPVIAGSGKVYVVDYVKPSPLKLVSGEWGYYLHEYDPASGKIRSVVHDKIDIHLPMELIPAKDGSLLYHYRHGLRQVKPDGTGDWLKSQSSVLPSRQDGFATSFIYEGGGGCGGGRNTLGSVWDIQGSGRQTQLVAKDFYRLHFPLEFYSDAHGSCVYGYEPRGTQGTVNKLMAFDATGRQTWEKEGWFNRIECVDGLHYLAFKWHEKGQEVLVFDRETGEQKASFIDESRKGTESRFFGSTLVSVDSEGRVKAREVRTAWNHEKVANRIAANAKAPGEIRVEPAKVSIAGIELPRKAGADSH